MEGKTQSNITRFYNLDVIISVGYRVKSLRGTQFRIWATGILKEYMQKVFSWSSIKAAFFILEKRYESKRLYKKI